MSATREPIEVSSKEQFDELLASAETKLVVVDFWGSWCRPCKGMKPKFAELAAAEPTVVCLAVNVGELGDLAEAYGVSSLPSFRFIKEGKVVDEFVGTNFDSLMDKVNKLK